MKFKSPILYVTALLVLLSLPTTAVNPKLLEVHTLFLYNFTKHIQWKSIEGKNEFVIGIYNNDEVYEFISKRMANKYAWRKPIKVIKISSPADVQSCEIAYLPESNKKTVLAFAAGIDKQNTLLVSDYDLIEMGAHICFFLKNSKPNYKISKSSMEANGMKVSNQLLSLGTPV